MIEVQSLNFSYSAAPGKTPGTNLFNDLSFILPAGEITVLMGPSGCGKSTLLRILMGAEPGAQGKITVDNEVFDFAIWNTSQQIFGLVPQVPHLFPWKTVYDNIALAVPASVSEEEKTKRIKSVLATIQLSDSAKKYPGEISQGMASRVAFARTLVMDIKAILLDEPFAALDAMTRSHLQKWIADEIRSSGLPAFFVTHDIQEALLLGSTILVLDSHKSLHRFAPGEATVEKIHASLN